MCLEREDMKIEEAIKELNSIVFDAKFAISEYGCKTKAVFDMAVEALEKQIPKKHDIDIFDYGSGYVCGNCGEFLLYMDDDDERFKTNYCCYCGQKIEW